MPWRTTEFYAVTLYRLNWLNFHESIETSTLNPANTLIIDKTCGLP